MDGIHLIYRHAIAKTEDSMLALSTFDLDSPIPPTHSTFTYLLFFDGYSPQSQETVIPLLPHDYCMYAPITLKD